MAGLIGYGAYIPHHRLRRRDIAAVLGDGGGSGTRAVASYDEEATTMAVEAARITLDGDLPVNPDGGLKAFGHPIGASGLRMLFECRLQLRGEARPERRIHTVTGGKKLALTQNLGGAPGD